MSNSFPGIRLIFIFWCALAVTALTAAAIWAPVFWYEHAAAEEARAADEAARPPIDSFVEGGRFGYYRDRPQLLTQLLLYESISLERTPCFGPCPVYVVTFFKDGRATLVTNRFAEGGAKSFTATIRMDEYVRLSQMVELARSAAKQERYAGQWTDDYTAIIRAKSQDELWTVEDYGEVAPIEVWMLEKHLHALKGDIKWARGSGP